MECKTRDPQSLEQGDGTELSMSDIVSLSSNLHLPPPFLLLPGLFLACLYSVQQYEASYSMNSMRFTHTHIPCERH
jgi:hypothetical protein